MTGRILLHAGAPKTDRPYLQKRWREHAAYLRGHGIYLPILPDFEKMAGNAKILPVAIDKAGSASFRNAFPHVDPAGLDPQALAAALLEGWRRGAEDLLLSAENFRGHHAPAMRRVLPGDAEIVPVLFVRAQDDWTNSYYNQLIKTGDIAMDIDAFVDELCDGPDGRIAVPDWARARQAWADAFGSCHIVLYAQARHDLHGAFLAAAGLDPMPGLGDIPPAQVSLGTHSLAYLREHADGRGFGRRVAAARAAAERLGDGGVANLITPALRQRLRGRFADPNRALLATLRLDDSLLAIADDAPCIVLAEVEASAAYGAFRDLADEDFAARLRAKAGTAA